MFGFVTYPAAEIFKGARKFAFKRVPNSNPASRFAAEVKSDSATPLIYAPATLFAGPK